MWLQYIISCNYILLSWPIPSTMFQCPLIPQAYLLPLGHSVLHEVSPDAPCLQNLLYSMCVAHVGGATPERHAVPAVLRLTSFIQCDYLQWSPSPCKLHSVDENKFIACLKHSFFAHLSVWAGSLTKLMGTGL